MMAKNLSLGVSLVVGWSIVEAVLWLLKEAF